MMALSHYTGSDKDADGVKDCEELAAKKDMASPISHPPIRYNLMRNSSSRFSTSSYSGGRITRVTFSRWIPDFNYILTQGTANIDRTGMMNLLNTEQPYPIEPPITPLVRTFQFILNERVLENDVDSHEIGQARVWTKMDSALNQDITHYWLTVTEPFTGYNWQKHPVEKLDLSIHPQKIIATKQLSEPFDFSYTNITDAEGEHVYKTTLFPMGRAPDVLPVNSDFDEGRIDPTTGYAMPDCDDEFGKLNAVRDHLDGDNKKDQTIVDDMHYGWFGLHPKENVPDEIFENATITIEKMDVIDPTTGYKEEGHVRFYAVDIYDPTQNWCIEAYNFTTLATKNLCDAVDSGIRGTVGSVYSTNAPWANSKKMNFYMEGVHPGYITLKWRYKKNHIDISFQQRFLVCTQKNAREWKNELAYKIRLETDNDPSGRIDVRLVPYPAEDYWPRMERISEYYDFYQECYREPLRSHPTGPANAMSWPGLARLAGSQVVAGLSDSEYARVPIADLSWITFDDLGIDWTEQLIKDIQYELFFGGMTIFRSIGWQMHAFRSSGFWALDWVADNDPIDEEAKALRILKVWRNLYDGIKTSDVAKLNKSAEDITDREQNVTIVETWDHINAMAFGAVSSAFSLLAQNSMAPLGDDFRQLYPAPKQMTITADRWDWIKPATPTGVLNTWNTAPIATKHSYVYRHLTTDAKRFALAQIFIPQMSGPGHFVHLPIKCNDDKDIP